MLIERFRTWGLWLLAVVLLTVKCYVFDAVIARPDALSWELTDWLAATAAAALVALPVVWSARRWLIFVLLGLADIWMIANILYFRAYRLFITWHLLSVAGNLNGFEDSILPYCDRSLWLFPLLTLPALLCLLWPPKRAGLTDILAMLLISVLCSLSASYTRWRSVRAYLPEDSFSAEWLNPCALPQALSADISERERQAGKYIHYHSILAYPLFMATDAITNRPSADDIVLSEEEQAELSRLLRPAVPAAEPQGNLVIVLLESFESWLLDARDAEGALVCPRLNHYIATHELCYVKDVSTQIQYGMSGDGQLLVNTGLFPTLEGIACVDYGYNTYPNLAHFYPHSAIVNPCRNVWNQRVVTTSYGYQQLIEPDSENRFEWDDSIVVDKMIATLESMPAPCCVMGITVSGHLPFTQSQDAIPMADTIPALFSQYMRTAHFTDRQIGRLLEWADTAQVMRHSTIAITGDHRIFHAWGNEEIRDFGLRAHLPFGTGQAGCPFLLMGPRVPAIRSLQAEQIDIFPTLLEAIGQKNYFWQSMGHSCLRPETADTNDRYFLHRQLSDKLIRMDYFAPYSVFCKKNAK